MRPVIRSRSHLIPEVWNDELLPNREYYLLVFISVVLNHHHLPSVACFQHIIVTGNVLLL